MTMKLRVAMKTDCVTMGVGEEGARGLVSVAKEGRATPQLAVSHRQSHSQLMSLRVGQTEWIGQTQAKNR
jgi:hypothetical protein